MKFKVECNYAIRTEQEITLNPKDFLYCTNIEELLDEVLDKFYDKSFPDFVSKNCNQDVVYQELMGLRYYDTWFESDDNKSFLLEWQRLKGLPQEL